MGLEWEVVETGGMNNFKTGLKRGIRVLIFLSFNQTGCPWI